MYSTSKEALYKNVLLISGYDFFLFHQTQLLIKMYFFITRIC